jgi:HK97 family phage major capsid protein
MSVQELLEQRAALFSKAQAIVEKDGGVDMTPEEERKVDAMFADADELSKKINSEERNSRLRTLGGEVNRPAQTLGPVVDSDAPGSDACEDRAFDNWLRKEAGPEYRAVMTTTTNSAAIPTEWTNYIVEKLYQENVMRRLCAVKTSGSETKINVEGAAVGEAACVAEGTEIDNAATSSLATSSVTVDAFMRRPEVWCTVELLQDSSFNLESYIGSRIGLLVGRGEEKDFIQGGGTTEPTGLKTQATVTQTRTADSSTYLDSLDSDDIWDFIFKLPPAYRHRSSTSILCSDAFVKAVRKITDTAGRSLWQPMDRYSDLRDGVPGTLGGIPYHTSPYMDIVDGTCDAFVGDFGYGEVWQRSGMTMFQDPYSLSSSAKVKYIARMRSDFIVTQAEAFVKMISA